MPKPSLKKQMADEASDELLQLYVRPCYLKLLNGNFAASEQDGDGHFPAYLALAARTITSAQLRRFLRDQDWRTRLTAAWFAGLTGRIALVGVLTRLLRKNRGAYDDQGFCVALGLWLLLGSGVVGSGPRRGAGDGWREGRIRSS